MGSYGVKAAVMKISAGCFLNFIVKTITQTFGKIIILCQTMFYFKFLQLSFAYKFWRIGAYFYIVYSILKYYA